MAGGLTFTKSVLCEGKHRYWKRDEDTFKGTDALRPKSSLNAHSAKSFKQYGITLSLPGQPPVFAFLVYCQKLQSSLICI